MKHTDSRYKAGLWFAAVRCLDCPAYSTWSVFHTRATPQVLTTTHMLTKPNSCRCRQVVNISSSVSGSEFKWFQACVSDLTTGIQIETLVPPALSQAGLRASFLISSHSNDVMRRTSQDIQMPGSAYAPPGWNVPLWQSADLLFNSTGSSTWGFDDTVCSSNSSNMLKLCPSSPGFTTGPLWIAVFVDCQLLKCAELTVPFTLLVSPPTESIRLFYQLGLQEEFLNYCIQDGNNALDTTVEQFRAGRKCAITWSVFNSTLVLYGAWDKTQIDAAFWDFDTNHNQFI